jgi:hypothetical protein
MEHAVSTPFDEQKEALKLMMKRIDCAEAQLDHLASRMESAATRLESFAVRMDYLRLAMPSVNARIDSLVDRRRS